MASVGVAAWFSVGLQAFLIAGSVTSDDFVTPSGYTVLDVKNVEVFQSDFLDSNLGRFGADDDVTSCYVSGSGREAWWKMIMNTTEIIRGFLFKGYWEGAVKIRVGKFHSGVGDMTGHRVNPPCQNLMVDGERDYEFFQCMVPMKGHVISVEGTTLDYGISASLKICDLKVLV